MKTKKYYVNKVNEYIKKINRKNNEIKELKEKIKTYKNQFLKLPFNYIIRKGFVISVKNEFKDSMYKIIILTKSDIIPYVFEYKDKKQMLEEYEKILNQLI